MSKSQKWYFVRSKSNMYLRFQYNVITWVHEHKAATKFKKANINKILQKIGNDSYKELANV